MYQHRAAWLIVVIAALMGMLGVAAASGTRSGEWTVLSSEVPQAVRLTLQSARGRDSFHVSADWPKAEFSGLDFARSGVQQVRFTLTRDAGKFNFEGVLRDGVGAGSFEFSPDAHYATEMQALGFAGVNGEQLALAVHDVSLSFAREMKNEKLQNLDTDKLLAFRIHGVRSKFIAQLHTAGIDERDSDTLVAFRIHAVTPEMVQRLRVAGYKPDSEDLIAMRIHGATFEWMEQLKQRGYQDVALAQLIAFRIHDVSPQFIAELQQLGYQHPQPEQLVNMRIHGVTPEYIAALHARGVKGLTVEKLVAMKIHGID